MAHIGALSGHGAQRHPMAAVMATQRRWCLVQPSPEQSVRTSGKSSLPAKPRWSAAGFS